MLYSAKCYWPGINATEFERVAASRLAKPGVRGPAAAGYLGSILFPDAELVLCLFEASSSAAVRSVAEQARIPCERIIESVWLASTARVTGWPTRLMTMVHTRRANPPTSMTSSRRMR